MDDIAGNKFLGRKRNPLAVAPHPRLHVQLLAQERQCLCARPSCSRLKTTFNTSNPPITAASTFSPRKSWMMIVASRSQGMGAQNRLRNSFSGRAFSSTTALGPNRFSSVCASAVVRTTAVVVGFGWNGLTLSGTYQWFLKGYKRFVGWLRWRPKVGADRNEFSQRQLWDAIAASRQNACIPLGTSRMSAQSLTPTKANNNRRGLTTAEAHTRLKQFGPNAVVEEKARPLKEFLKRFWAPIPWLLEATIIIQLFLDEKVEAAVIGGLLVLNAILSLLQEGRAQRALALLRQQLHVQARVRRDGTWITLPAEELGSRGCRPFAPRHHSAGGCANGRRVAAGGPVRAHGRIGGRVSRGGQDRLRGLNGARRRSHR